MELSLTPSGTVVLTKKVRAAKVDFTLSSDFKLVRIHMDQKKRIFPSAFYLIETTGKRFSFLNYLSGRSTKDISNDKWRRKIASKVMHLKQYQQKENVEYSLI